MITKFYIYIREKERERIAIEQSNRKSIKKKYTFYNKEHIMQLRRA